MTHPSRRRGALALLAAAAVGAAGMTAFAASAPPTVSRNLTNGVTELSFSPQKLTVKVPHGATKVRVALRFRDTGSTEHSIGLRGRGLAGRVSPLASAGSSTPVTVRAVLGPGTYTYYCGVPGHEAAGMKGTLKVVKAS